VDLIAHPYVAISLVGEGTVRSRPRRFRSCSEYFLLGDAAATLNSLSSHGVLRATMSGMLCAYLVAANARRTVSAPQAISAYVGWMNEQFERDVLMLRTLYRDHPTRVLAALFREDVITTGR